MNNRARLGNDDQVRFGEIVTPADRSNGWTVGVGMGVSIYFVRGHITGLIESIIDFTGVRILFQSAVHPRARSAPWRCH